MLAPTTTKEVCEFLRKLADAIEKEEVKFRGAQLVPSVERSLVAPEKEADDFRMTVDVRFEVGKRSIYEALTQG